MRILYVTDYLPYPCVSGDLIRTYSLIRRVAAHHQVSLATFLERPDQISNVSHMQEFCHRVEVVNLPRKSKVARIPGLLRYILSGVPFDFEFLDSTRLKEKIRNLACEENFDIVQFEQSRMAPYLAALPSAFQGRTVLVFHNIASSQYRRIADIALTLRKRIRTWLHSWMLRRWEPRYAERFDRCIAVSEVDRDLLVKENSRLKGAVDVVPNGVDTRGYQPLPIELIPPNLLLIGSMDYEPCADGAVWFCRKILPEIIKVIGPVQVWIVGNSPPPIVTRLDSASIHVTGRVDDVVDYYRQCAISIVPIRAGGGTRLKILEAMALGRPVVSTTIGCEGLDVEDGRHLLIADEPGKFADNIVRLLNDPSLCRRIVREGRHLVESQYDWDVVTEHLLEIYSQLAKSNLQP